MGFFVVREGCILDVARLKTAVSDLAARSGLLLVDLSWVQTGRRSLLRVLIDRPGRVTVGECAAFSRQLEDVLDRDLDPDGPYMLEVSSPGVGRRLESEVDWIRCVGRHIRVEIPGEVVEDELLGYEGGCLVFPGSRIVPTTMITRAVETLDAAGRKGDKK
jgi:ribosome maturation factor RimP